MIESAVPVDGSRQLTAAELEAGLAGVRDSPSTEGTLVLVARRPAVDAREVLAAAELDADEGLLGDTWRIRGSKRTADGAAHPDMQLNVMNARLARLIAVDPERMPLAGDQLYVDLDLSHDNLPAGTRLAVGTAVIEVTDQPHNGCKKFAARFGVEALRLVNSDVGKQLQLRGLNARVVTGGTISPGDAVTKLP